MRWSVGIALFIVLAAVLYWSVALQAPENAIDAEMHELTRMLVTDQKAIMDHLSRRFNLMDSEWKSFTDNAWVVLSFANLNAIEILSLDSTLEGDVGRSDIRAICYSAEDDKQWTVEATVYFAKERPRLDAGAAPEWKITNIEIVDASGAKSPIAALLPRLNAGKAGFSNNWLPKFRPSPEDRLKTTLKTIGEILVQGNEKQLELYYPGWWFEIGQSKNHIEPATFFRKSAFEIIRTRYAVSSIQVVNLKAVFEEMRATADVEYAVAFKDKEIQPVRLKGQAVFVRNPGDSEDLRTRPLWLPHKILMPDSEGRLVGVGDILYRAYGDQ